MINNRNKPIVTALNIKALLTFLILLSALCSSNAISETKFEQRKKYLDAAYLARTGQHSRFLKLKNELADYALEPYLSYIDLTHRISRISADQVAKFRQQYADTPLADSLMQNWLYTLAKRGRWEEYLTYFEPPLTTKILSCFELYALHRTGHTEEALIRTREVWLVDYSQPDECDPLLKVWTDSNQLTADLAWERFSISLQANHTSLADYLVRFLDQDDRHLASLMRQVHRKPELVRNASRFRNDDDRTRAVIMHGIRKLAQRDANQALDMWEHYISSKTFSEQEIENTYSFLAIRLALQGDTQNRIDAIPISLRDNMDLMEARIRLALNNQDWNQVLVMIHALPPEWQATDRWQYWNARVLANSDNSLDRASAQAIFQQLATARSYYGFLSADLLGEPYNFEASTIGTDRAMIDAIAARPGIERALELYALGEKSWARREWQYSTRNMTETELGAAARVAQNWGWYEQSIKNMIKAEHWDDLDLRFPVAFQDYFIANATISDIPVYWSLAIARQESAFMTDAKSPAGAMGLMQVMPATARLIAGDAKVSYKNENDLIDPMTNITLGSTYLGQMLRRFDNNRVIASAAYNAGPFRVDGWLNYEQPLDVWIETIPYTETRNYVQNVLVYSVIYSHRLNYQQPMIYPHELRDFSVNQVSFRKE